MRTLVPPIKCQGIKTKLAPTIRAALIAPLAGRWIEPFCGSCVVALNVRPERALLTDVNRHIIGFYQAIQRGDITPAVTRAYLQEEGSRLSRDGEAHYYAIRERFNATRNPLDLLFLSRAGFNGVMRFNRSGKYNVPFCRKPDRFRPAHITKIANQVGAFADAMRGRDWRFEVADFRTTLAQASANDVVYADPPYAGRHVDYFNRWSADDEEELSATLKALPCPFILSTWHSNRYRENTRLHDHWRDARYSIATIEHFYHVGPTEDLRNAMTEALITNYAVPRASQSASSDPAHGRLFQYVLPLDA